MKGHTIYTKKIKNKALNKRSEIGIIGQLLDTEVNA